MLSDDELILRLRNGDTKAFDKLYARYSKPLFNFICRILNDRGLAEDLLQEAFLRILTKSYKPQAKFSTWLYTVATNLCLNEIRKRTRTSRLEKDIPNPRDRPHREAERRELAQKIEEAISFLPTNQRVAFCLRHYQGMPYREIARVLKCPLGTVKSRIHNAVRNLKTHLEDYYDV